MSTSEMAMADTSRLSVTRRDGECGVHLQSIGTCISALFAAQYHSRWRTALWIVVVVDSSSDETARRAREALGAFGAVLDVSAHSPQACHQIGEAAVLRHFEATRRHALLITSADPSTAVCYNWIDERVRSATLLAAPRQSLRRSPCSVQSVFEIGAVS